MTRVNLNPSITDNSRIPHSHTHYQIIIIYYDLTAITIGSDSFRLLEKYRHFPCYIMRSDIIKNVHNYVESWGSK